MLRPHKGTRETQFAQLVLTDAELDHTLGLLMLRQAAALTVTPTASVPSLLERVLRLLTGYLTVVCREIPPGTTLRLTPCALLACRGERSRWAQVCRPPTRIGCQRMRQWDCGSVTRAAGASFTRHVCQRQIPSVFATVARHALGRCSPPSTRGRAMYTQYTERYAKLPLMILLHRADLRLPRSLILKTEGFA
jgi:hypothetical protein